MDIELIDIDKLTPYEKNPRVNEKTVKFVAASIKEFGFKSPIIADKDGVIVAGHTRLKAAIKLGIKSVPVIYADDLTPEQIAAYRLADNKTAELSSWDTPLLAAELDSLSAIKFDMTRFGFDKTDDELEDDFDLEGALGEEKSVSQVGQVWQLGRHKLICADSTNKEEIARLMDGAQVDLVFTDPPYNIDYQDMKKTHQKIKNDKMSDDNFQSFLDDSFENIIENSYVCCNWKYYHIFYKALMKRGFPVKACIVWDKEIGVQNLDKYFKQHEFILYTGKFGGQKTLGGDVFRTRREKNTLHPTMKPIALCSYFIKNSSKEGDIILDIFGGSGSTLIAAEQLGRTCYMSEISPVYCDVIIKRYEELTGEKGVVLVDRSKALSDIINNSNE